MCCSLTKWTTFFHLLNDISRLSLEVVIEPTVDERVVAHRTGGEPQAKQESIVIGRFGDAKVEQKVVHVEGEPAQCEYGHDEHQHQQAATLLLAQLFALALGYLAHLALRGYGESYARVDHARTRQGDEVLSERGEQCEHQVEIVTQNTVPGPDGDATTFGNERRCARVLHIDYHDLIENGVGQRVQCRQKPYKEDQHQSASARIEAMATCLVCVRARSTPLRSCVRFHFNVHTVRAIVR